MAEHMPEDVIVKIFQRLPIKSLIRFTSVSKRWRFIILRDPHFATSHYQIASHSKTLRHSICFDSYVDSHYCFDSPNSQTPSSSSLAVRNLRYPPMKPHSRVHIHSSCRGLVFIEFEQHKKYIWNPSTGLFKELPDFERHDNDFRTFTGFGYVSATRDYKILIATFRPGQREQGMMIRIFSSKSNSWGTIQDSQYSSSSMTVVGTLSNEALHWLRESDNVIVAFGLGNEEFRTMRLPFIVDESPEYEEGKYRRHLGDFGGCLCVFQARNDAASMDYWVMREYNVGNSWTKLFNLRITNKPEGIYNVLLILLTETYTYLEIYTLSEFGGKLVRIDHEEEKIEDIQMHQFGLIGYEESLLWIE